MCPVLQEEQQTRDLSDFLSRAAKEMSEQDMQVLALSYGLNGDKPMKRTVSTSRAVRQGSGPRTHLVFVHLRTHTSRPVLVLGLQQVAEKLGLKVAAVSRVRGMPHLLSV